MPVVYSTDEDDTLSVFILMDGNIGVASLFQARRKNLCKRYSTKSRMALKSRADSGLNPLFTESHGGQNGMRAGTA